MCPVLPVFPEMDLNDVIICFSQHVDGRSRESRHHAVTFGTQQCVRV